MKFIENDNVDTTSRSTQHHVGSARTSTDWADARELVAQFEGVNSLLAYVADKFPRPNRDGSSADMKRPDWHVFDTFEQAMDVYVHRPSTVRQYDESAVQIVDGENAGAGIAYELTGDFLDIGRFLEGEPDCQGVVIDGNPRGKRVNLIINLGFLGYTNRDDVIYRGQRIQRLVDWLENQNVRVRVDGLISNSCVHVEINVKDYDEALDLNDIAVCSHSDFHRRIIFRMAEYSATWISGYGSSERSANLIDGLKIPPPDLANEVTVVVNNELESHARVASEFDQLEQWLTAALPADLEDPDDRYRIILGGNRWPFDTNRQSGNYMNHVTVGNEPMNGIRNGISAPQPTPWHIYGGAPKAPSPPIDTAVRNYISNHQPIATTWPKAIYSPIEEVQRAREMQRLYEEFKRGGSKW